MPVSLELLSRRSLQCHRRINRAILRWLLRDSYCFFNFTWGSGLSLGFWYWKRPLYLLSLISLGLVRLQRLSSWLSKIALRLAASSLNANLRSYMLRSFIRHSHQRLNCLPLLASLRRFTDSSFFFSTLHWILKAVLPVISLVASTVLRCGRFWMWNLLGATFTFSVCCCCWLSSVAPNCTIVTKQASYSVP